MNPWQQQYQQQQVPQQQMPQQMMAAIQVSNKSAEATPSSNDYLALEEEHPKMKPSKSLKAMKKKAAKLQKQKDMKQQEK